MSRMLSPDSACREVEVINASGRRRLYGSMSQQGGGVLEVAQGDRKALREAGFTDASASGSLQVANGYTCTGCGKGSFFTTCGRCGAACRREAS